jgi:hypothetical protein
MSTWGIIFIFVILGLLILLLQTTRGVLNHAQWVLMLVAIALITGLTFWIWTESSGQLTVKQLGIELGGGAGIGASFMLLAWKLVTSRSFQKIISPFVVVSIPTEGRSSIFYLSWHSKDIVSALNLKDNRRMLFEFGEGKFSGEINIRYLAKDASKWNEVKYKIDRSGRLIDTTKEA